jgi:hypothetical protein
MDAFSENPERGEVERGGVLQRRVLSPWGFSTPQRKADGRDARATRRASGPLPPGSRWAPVVEMADGQSVGSNPETSSSFQMAMRTTCGARKARGPFPNYGIRLKVKARD